MEKGEEIGYFAFGGSTILLLFPPNPNLVFDEDLSSLSLGGIETLVKMGNSIGKIVESKVPPPLRYSANLPHQPHLREADHYHSAPSTITPHFVPQLTHSASIPNPNSNNNLQHPNHHNHPPPNINNNNNINYNYNNSNMQNNAGYFMAAPAPNIAYNNYYYPPNYHQSPNPQSYPHNPNINVNNYKMNQPPPHNNNNNSNNYK